MRVKLHDQEPRKLRLAVVVPTTQMHASREQMYSHTIDDQGNLVPSHYLRAVIKLFADMMTRIQKLPEVQIHLLNRKRGSSNYKQLLVVISSLSDSFEQYDQFVMHYGHKLDEISEAGLAKSRAFLRQSEQGLSLHPEMFPTTMYMTRGFELSTLELEYLIQKLVIDNQPLELPTMEGERSMGMDVCGSPINLPEPGMVIMPQQPQLLPNFTRQGIVLTRSPENYSQVADFVHHLGPEESPIGVNLLQFYTSQPGLLVDLLAVLHTLTKDYHIERTFLSVLDELFSTMPREEFIGISIKNFFIDDDYNAYQTMSDQQSKYQLHQHFASYLNHEIFNVNAMDRLQYPGLHVLDLSQLSREMALMVDIMFRLLQKYGYLEGTHISDYMGEEILAAQTTKFAHLQTLSTPSILMIPTFSTELLKGSDWDIYLTNLQQLRHLELSDWELDLLEITELQDYLETAQGYLLCTKYLGTTIIEELDSSPELPEEPLLEDIVFDYSVEEEEDVVVDTLDEEDDEEFYEDRLSQYHIISILAAMPDHSHYSIADIELALWSEYQLGEYITAMVDRQYLKEDGKFVTAAGKGRTYLARITRQCREDAIEEEYDNSIKFLTGQITDYMTADRIDERLQILHRMYLPLEELAGRIDANALLYHYYGLVASTLYQRDHPDSDEQLTFHMKTLSTILDDKTAEEDLIELVMVEMEEEDDFEAAIDRVMDTEDVQQIIDQTVKSEVSRDTFVPVEHPPKKVGRWIPSPHFLEIVDSPVMEEEQIAVTPSLIYLLYSSNYLDISTKLELELYLDRLGLTDLKAAVLDHPAVDVSGTRLTIELDQVSSPMVPAGRSTMKRDRIIPYIKKLLPDLSTQLVSQNVKQQLISVMTQLGLQQYGFLLHAMMAGEDTFLVETLEELLQGIVNPEADIARYLRHDLDRSDVYRRLHGMTTRQPKKSPSRPDLPPAPPATDTGTSGPDDDKKPGSPTGEEQRREKQPRKMVKKALVSTLPRPNVTSKEKKPSVDFLTSIKMEEGKIPPSTTNSSGGSTQEEGSQHKEKPSKNDEISVLGYPLQVKDGSPGTEDADAATEQTQPALTSGQQAIYDRLSSEHPMIELSRIAPRADLSYGTILTMVHKIARILEEGPEKMLQEMISHIFGEYGIKMDTFPPEVIITNLTQISKRVDMDFSGFVQNYADIASNWEETHNTTILYYYLNRCITACNDFVWDEAIRNYIS